jgi:phospholipid/cholesterol/gamma-HCH transport system substrate-binding protein
LKISREVKTAILVISSIVLFIWGYSFLKGKDILSSYKTLYVYYDNVEGLSPSAPVTFNGLSIGKIQDISFDPSKQKMMVEFQVKKDFHLSKSSEVAMYQTSPIGGKQLMIIPNYEDQNMTVNGDVLVGSNKAGLMDVLSDKLEPLEDKMNKIMTNADKVLVNVNQVLDEKSKENLRQSIANLNATLAEFSQVSKSVNSMMTDNKAKWTNASSNIEKISGDFAKISDSLAKANLSGTIKNLEKTLANVDKMMASMESGQGTMGKLLKDDQLYANFAKASSELELLLEDLRLNPTRYVNVSLFGKKNKPYVAPVVDTLSNKN